MEFDFTNVSDTGFVELEPGRYKVVTQDWWKRVKEDTGNVVLDIDLKVTEGKFDGSTIRYFHTITNKEISKGFLLAMFSAVGLIREGDRGNGGSLKPRFVFGDKDDKGRERVVSLSVNGQERKVEGLLATAVVVKGESRSQVQRLEAVGASTSASVGNIVSQSSPGNSGDTKPSLPF